MSTPTVSVLMTAYNREDYIAAAIESVLAQTFTDFELIICDDQSVDRTVEIASGYAQQDPRVRLVRNDRNLGDYGNRRQAAALARGPFLKYHDSDDVMYPHCLAAMVNPLTKEPRASFALSGARAWPGGPCPMLLTPALAYEREYLGSGVFHLGPAAAMFRTEIFRELGGFPDAGVASDYLFWMAACAKVNVLLVPGDLFYYRVHPKQEYAKPESDAAYAKASGVAWAMLKSPECPLSGEVLEQGKRNYVYTNFRGAFRHLRRGRPRSAVDILRFIGLTPAEWLRYLRRPHRMPMAGTPREPRS
jgi:glycosyltransferase involved in cell wall biosynthesis